MRATGSLTTRRAALRQLATASAAVAVTTPAIAGTADADAELIALGRQFEPLFAQWLVATEQQTIKWIAFDAEMVRVTGMTRAEAPLLQPKGQNPPGGYWDIWEKTHARSTDETPENPGDQERLGNNHLWPLADRIMEHSPASLAGLAVQARALTFMHEDWWLGITINEPLEIDGVDAAAKLLIENLCRVAGVPVGMTGIGGETATPLAAAKAVRS